MGPRIFISHASQDRRVAERICAALESRALACWISTRDIRPGEAFADAIVRAIEQAKVMLLVFSTHANNSGEVLKELALASKQRLVVIPLRVEDVIPTGAFTYELATRQWLDLLDDWDHGMEQLAGRIAPLVTSGVAPDGNAAAGPAARLAGGRRGAVRWRRPALIALTLAALAAGAAALWSRPAAPPAAIARAPGEVFRDCPECPEMAAIPAGRFTMGSPPGEEERERVSAQNKGNAMPLRTVSVRGFALGKHEVSRAEFTAFAEATGVQPGEGCETWEDNRWNFRARRNWRSPGYTQAERDPAVCVSWDDARAYANWLARRTGKTYRLPTEAEFEYAARAGTPTTRYWGDAIGTAQANCDGCGSQWDRRQAAPVGSFAANAFGLHDMLGNLSEWVEDCWNDSYAGAPADGSAWTTGNCSRRPLRGGSWLSDPEDVRASYRYRIEPGYRASNVGFRVARGE